MQDCDVVNCLLFPRPFQYPPIRSRRLRNEISPRSRRQCQLRPKMARLNMASPHIVLTIHCYFNAFPGHFSLHHFSFPVPNLISFFILLSLPVCSLFCLSLSLYLYYTPNLPAEKFLVLFTGNNSL